MLMQNSVSIWTANGRTFSPANMFTDGEQGFAYDISNPSLLFQDAAGTIPVTAAGDPVGLVLDQARSDGRGVVNLVTSSGDVSATAWATNSSNITRPSADTIVENTATTTHVLIGANTSFTSGLVYTKTITLRKGLLATAPDVMQITFAGAAFGTGQFANVNVLTGAVLSVTGATCTSVADPEIAGAWRFTYTATATATTSTGAFVLFFCNNNPSATRATSYTGSITSDCRVYRMQTQLGSTATTYQANGATVGGPGNHSTQSVSAARPRWGRWPLSAVIAGRVRNLLVNTATLSTQSRTVTAVSHTLQFKGTGTVTLSGASTAGPLVGTGANDVVTLTFTPSAASLTLTVTGTVTEAQLEIGTATTPQIVGASSAWDVTEAGQPTQRFLYFDGLDDFLQTGSINFTSTDEMFVCAGVTKITNAASGCLLESSVNRSLNNGAVSMFVPSGGLSGGVYVSRGTIDSLANSTALVPPISTVLSGISEISADTCNFRSDGVQIATSATDQGTGNYGNYPVFLGARAGTSFFFTGNLYSLVMRGKLPTTTQLGQTEQWTARRVKGTL